MAKDNSKNKAPAAEPTVKNPPGDSNPLSMEEDFFIPKRATVDASAEDQDPRDQEISASEAALDLLLRERNDELEKAKAELKQAGIDREGDANTIARLLEENAELRERAKKQKPSKTSAPEGDHVVFRGHFRADNTFAEVKRGHCDEGCTLIAIARPH